MLAHVWAMVGAVGLYFGVHWAYVLVISAKAALEAGRLTRYWKVILFPAAVLGGVLDFLFQYSFGWVMFVETPFRGGVFFSGRVQHHIDSSSGWRLQLAKFWQRTLNVFEYHIRDRRAA